MTVTLQMVPSTFSENLVISLGYQVGLIRRIVNASVGFPTPANLFEFLKKILHEHDIPFTVAPYSAMAQVRCIVADRVGFD